MIATMMMRVRVLTAASWLDLVPSETRQSPYAAAMATAAFAVFGVKFELDFHCRAAMRVTKNNNTKYEEEQY